MVLIKKSLFFLLFSLLLTQYIPQSIRIYTIIIILLQLLLIITTITIIIITILVIILR